MPNVFFKKGTQAGFNAITAGSFTPGAFYLTTDTQRLYYADSAAGAHQVNPGITTVANIASLPKSNQISAADYGQFYYCVNENVLAIFNQGQWVQINSYEDTVLDARTVTATKSGNTVTVTDVLFQSDTSKGGGKITSEYEFTGANGLIANVVPKYRLATAYHAGTQYYTKSGDTYTAATVTDTSFNKTIHYVQSGYAITLTAPTYTLTSAVTGADGAKEATITLGGATENNQVVIAAGNNTSISTDANGKIVINASDGDTLYDVTGSNETSGFGISVKMGSGLTKKGTIDPIIKLDSSVAESATGYKFANGTLSLPVYSKSEVDKKINDFNAMEYRGVLTGAGVVAKLSSTTEKNGYVYMLAEDNVTLNLNNETDRKILASGGVSVTATPGDLIVVQGEEENGVVKTVTLVHVPSGNDHDTTYKFTKVEHGLLIEDDQGGSKTGLRFEAKDDLITLTDTENTGTTKEKIVTIEHKKVTQTSESLPDQTQQTEQNIDITISTPIVDGAGHVTGAKTQKFTIVDTHATVENAINVSAAENVATVESVVKVDGGEKKADFTLQSESLTITASEKNISLNLEWGSF